MSAAAINRQSVILSSVLLPRIGRDFISVNNYS
jgi:hypothetical protein